MEVERTRVGERGRGTERFETVPSVLMQDGYTVRQSQRERDLIDQESYSIYIYIYRQERDAQSKESETEGDKTQILLKNKTTRFVKLKR